MVCVLLIPIGPMSATCSVCGVPGAFGPGSGGGASGAFSSGVVWNSTCGTVSCTGTGFCGRSMVGFGGIGMGLGCISGTILVSTIGGSICRRMVLAMPLISA